MEVLIPIINKLQDVFATVGTQVIDLPQIVVVGCQSSGKSSVLEAIVGRDFLPRGSGIVTRRPLILQLVHLDAPPPKGKPQEYGEFAHRPGEIFTDFNKINDEIVAETDRVTGTGRNVSPEPIRLKLWSHDVLNLTLVDLPGLTKVSIEGQNPNIVQEIHDMVKSFVAKPDSLILAVTPANQDIANSDSLRLAREVDPKGDRTIGVITKIDIMDQGTNARDVLENQVYPLKLGYIGVVNRSQLDINNKKSIEKQRADEKAFFENHRDYSDLADRCGTHYLTVVLNRLLMEHIRTCMPLLKHRVQSLLEEKEEELKGYGSDPNVNAAQLNAFILDTINKYLDIFNNYLSGKSAEGKEITTDEVRGGKIPTIFQEEFNREIDNLPGLAHLDTKTLYFMMKNHCGISVPLFTSNQAFHSMIRYALEQFREPSLKLVDTIVSTLFEIHQEVKFMELERFTALDGAMRAVVDKCIRHCVQPCKRYINDLIDNEKAYINTDRPDFRGSQRINAGKGGKDVRTRQLPRAPITPDPVAICTMFGNAEQHTEYQNRQMLDYQLIAQDYFDLIREQIKDIIPKTIIHLVLKKSTDMLRPTMIADVFNVAGSVQLAQEDPAITKKRISCKAIVDALKRAQEILLEVRSVKF